MNQRYCNGMIHVIKEGDNLYQLSRQYRVPLAMIMRANPYVDVYNLRIGQEICIPVSRPGPGLFPPFGAMRPPGPGNRPPEPPQRPGCCPGMTVERQEEGEEDKKEAEDNPEDNAEDMTEEVNEQEFVYVPEEKITLGEVLERWNMTMDEFMEKNGPENIYLAEGCSVYLDKKES